MTSHEFAKISPNSALFLKNKGRQSGIDKKQHKTKQARQKPKRALSSCKKNGDPVPVLLVASVEGLGTSLNLSGTQLPSLWHRDNIMSSSTSGSNGAKNDSPKKNVKVAWGSWFLTQSPIAQRSYGAGNTASPQEILASQMEKFYDGFLK